MPEISQSFKAGICLLILLSCFRIESQAGAASYTLHDTGERTPDSQTIFIRGVGAGAFNPDAWTTSPPHLIADVRHPLLEPRAGLFRNIYAPSAVAQPDGGWYVYYGGWDGIDEGRDAISVTTTTDFLTFGKRTTVVSPGPFQHVCNVNAQFASAGGGGVTLMCTVYPDASGRNKPGMFRLPGPVPEKPVVASSDSIVAIRGYKDYPDADINGMNVLLRDGDRNLLYFGDFRNFGNVYVATGDEGSTSTFDLNGVALDGRLAVNDVKILRDTNGEKWYLMGLHMNHGVLYYSLSRNPLSFLPATELLRSSGEPDKHIVALGWVTDRDSPQGAEHLLGVLYGAGLAPTLDTNRIFARWIQKRLDFQGGVGNNSNGNAAPKVTGALGPETVVLSANADSWIGDVKMFDESGAAQGQLTGVALQAGHVYELR